MILGDIGDWVVKIAAGPGFLTLLGKYTYDWIRNRKSRAEKRAESAKAKVEEETSQDKVTSSSITTWELKLVAADRAFGIERGSYERTIKSQEQELTRKDQMIAERDAIISELRTKVAEVQSQLDEMVRTLDALQNKE